MFKNEYDIFYLFGGGPYFGGGPGQLPHLPHGKSGPACVRSAGVRLGIQKTIHVVFADRVLVAILLCALRATDGFIKGAVASQVDRETMLSLL